jgi:hypothetical protein
MEEALRSITNPSYIYNNIACYVVEILFLHDLDRDQKPRSLPPSFWKDKRYKAKYVRYSAIVRRTIKLTSETAVLTAVAREKIPYCTYPKLLFFAKRYHDLLPKCNIDNSQVSNTMLTLINNQDTQTKIVPDYKLAKCTEKNAFRNLMG